MASHDHDELQQTRQRLLEAAGEIFADQGYTHATVREICIRAGANVAAVNYHFGDKEGLYRAVLQYAHRCSLPSDPSDFGVPDSGPPESRLQAFIEGFFRHLFEEGRPAWRGKIVSREMVEPTAALDAIVAEEIRPRSELLQSIVRQFLGDDTPAEVVSLCTFSIVSQCVFYHHARPVISRLRPQMTYTPQQVQRVAQHITGFCIAALRNWAPGNPVPPSEGSTP